MMNSAPFQTIPPSLNARIVSTDSDLTSRNDQPLCFCHFNVAGKTSRCLFSAAFRCRTPGLRKTRRPPLSLSCFIRQTGVIQSIVGPMLVFLWGPAEWNRSTLAAQQLGIGDISGPNVKSEINSMWHSLCTSGRWIYILMPKLGKKRQKGQIGNDRVSKEGEYLCNITYDKNSRIPNMYPKDNKLEKMNQAQCGIWVKEFKCPAVRLKNNKIILFSSVRG